MLLGTTYAWFTDSVTSANNIIQSGILDVVLEYKTNWSDDWAPVDENTKIFKDGALYEPGYTEVSYLRVSNAGSLALKYMLSFNIANEEGSINVYGDEFKLSDYLQVGTYVQDEYSSGLNAADIRMPEMFGDRESALKNVNLNNLSYADAKICDNAPLLPGEDTAQVVAIVLTMPETVGNEANTKPGEEAPYIKFGVRLFATQYTHENDSFGNQYDANVDQPTIHMIYDLETLERHSLKAVRVRL
jgi:predicted ribosomally synthesized peptide with SipW-like signal peptide